MNVGAIIRRAQKAASDNTPVLLTAIGVTGLISTAVLAGKASFKAAEVLDTHHHKLVDDKFEPLPTVEKAKILFPYVWKLYVPAAGTGALTIACIIAANRIHTRRAAALASAYTISQEAFREYKDKVLEKLGEKKEQAVRDEIATERVAKNPPAEIVIIGKGDVLCQDTHSGRYFNSTMEDLKAAHNKINFRILHDGYASLTDFWDEIGLPSTSESDEIGWNTDTGLDLEYATALTPDGRPCITITFQTVPGRGYYSVYN